MGHGGLLSLDLDRARTASPCGTPASSSRGTTLKVIVKRLKV
jgi:hypothetical protein